MVTRERPKLLPTGSPEIDELLGGGIPSGSLALLEGAADSGKSVLAQHFTYQALITGISVAYYTTEHAIKDLISQMSSLDLDVTDYFLCDRLRIYPLRPLSPPALATSSPGRDVPAFKRLMEHFECLPIGYQLLIIDALTDLMSYHKSAEPPDPEWGSGRDLVDFLASCKELCGSGRTILAAVSPDAVDSDALDRARSLCDSQLTLYQEQVDGRPVRSMEVPKVDNVQRPAGNPTRFSIEPGAGIRVLQLSGAGG